MVKYAPVVPYLLPTNRYFVASRVNARSRGARRPSRELHA